MTIEMQTSKKEGLTLIELTITISMMSVLVFTVGYTLVIGMKLSNEGYNRSVDQTNIAQALDLVSNGLRRATSIDALTAGSITFTADLDGDGDDDPISYRVYLYNSADPDPNPPYTKDTYELRWAQGTVTYGSGQIITANVDKPSPPSSKPFSQSGNLITMDFTVTSGSDTVNMRTNVRIRDL